MLTRRVEGQQFAVAWPLMQLQGQLWAGSRPLLPCPQLPRLKAAAVVSPPWRPCEFLDGWPQGVWVVRCWLWILVKPSYHQTSVSTPTAKSTRITALQHYTQVWISNVRSQKSIHFCGNIKFNEEFFNFNTSQPG